MSFSSHVDSLFFLYRAIFLLLRLEYPSLSYTRLNRSSHKVGFTRNGHNYLHALSELPFLTTSLVEENLEQPVITPSEAAILECMMEGGCHLNLKAHFLSQLPDISPLQNSLTYLNLSYNNLSVTIITAMYFE